MTKSYSCWFCGEVASTLTEHSIHVSTCEAPRSEISREVHCWACASPVDLRVSPVCSTCGREYVVNVDGSDADPGAAATEVDSGARERGCSDSGGTEMAKATATATETTTATKPRGKSRTCPGCGSTYGRMSKFTNEPERTFCFKSECAEREAHVAGFGDAAEVAEAIAETKTAVAKVEKAIEAVDETPEFGVVYGPDGAEGAKRLIAAQEECRAHKAWVKAGRKGAEPFTGNLDLVRAKHANGGVETAPKTSKSGSKRVKPPEATVRFTRNGKLLGASFDRLSRVVGHVFYVNGEDGKGSSLVSVAEFRTILADAGIESPETSKWEIEVTRGDLTVKVGAIPFAEVEAAA